MKISLLVSDLSSNCMVRTYPIAKVLQRHFEIEIVGPAFSGNVFPPYREEFVYKCVQFPEGWWQTRWRRRLCSLYKSVVNTCNMIEGDVVYAFKPRLSSFVPGVVSHLFGKRPLVLDIEDWEAEEHYSSSTRRKCRKLLELGDPQNQWYARWLEPLVGLADEKTVVSRFLQNRFGGIRLVHGADCDWFTPARFDRAQLRRRWGVENRKVILFSGQAAPHKGIADLCRVLQWIGDRSVLLLVVGTMNEYLAEIMRVSPDSIRHVPLQPHAIMPEFLALSDLVVLPSKQTPFAKAQVPGKVFEAMAMAKPIVATDMSDMGEILDGCGSVVPAEDLDALARAIEYIIAHPDVGEKMGQMAREKCQHCYSWDAMEETLLGLFGSYR